jgi:hypothetical protein
MGENRTSYACGVSLPSGIIFLVIAMFGMHGGKAVVKTCLQAARSGSTSSYISYVER